MQMPGRMIYSLIRVYCQDFNSKKKKREKKRRKEDENNKMKVLIDGEVDCSERNGTQKGQRRSRRPS